MNATIPAPLNTRTEVPSLDDHVAAGLNPAHRTTLEAYQRVTGESLLTLLARGLE